ncbi:hypothetical protein GQ457_12G018680 [Hibiscus cannabinus]
MALILMPPANFHSNFMPNSVSSSPVILSSPFLETTSFQLRCKASRTWPDDEKIGRHRFLKETEHRWLKFGRRRG